jgi:hypothetical protein
LKSIEKGTETILHLFTVNAGHVRRFSVSVEKIHCSGERAGYKWVDLNSRLVGSE